LDRAPAGSVNRTDRRRRVALVAALTWLLALGATARAGASVTIGQLPTSAPSPTCSVASTDYLQPSVTSGNLYVAKEAGTITSWSTRSFGAGATYGFKIFRRTSDPDVFQVISHATAPPLSTGLNTFSVSVPVRSGDMIGFNASGSLNSCTSSDPGDSVRTLAGNLPDGATGTFGTKDDVRLNLSAVLVPSNDFSVTISRNRRLGTATVTVHTSNPGTVSLTGKGLKSGRAAKAVFVAGPVDFAVSTTGRWKRKLAKTGKVTVGALITFAPTGGDPSSQPISLKLRKRRTLGSG